MGQFVAKIIAHEVRAGVRHTTSNAPNLNTTNGAQIMERGKFEYFDKGSMATIGRAKAVAEVAGLKFHGLIAWLAWLFVHLILLVGFNNRILVFMSWQFRTSHSVKARALSAAIRRRVWWRLLEAMPVIQRPIDARLLKNC